MATRTAIDLTFGEVNNCLTGTAGGSNQFNTPPADGDTIRLLSGTATWTNAITVSGRNLQIIGNGSANTIISCANPSARILELETINSDNTAILRGIQFQETLTVATPDLSRPTLMIWGKARVHWSGTAYVGGFWMDDVIWTATSTGATKNAHFSIGGTDITGTKIGCVSGLISHCRTTFGSVGPLTGETIQIACPGSPTGTAANGWKDTNTNKVSALGEWSWTQPYTWGGTDTSDPGNTFFQAVYVEDCVFDSVMDSLFGGGRFVFRHNTTHRILSRHGCETGNNTGGSMTEDYNNYFNIVTGNPFACDDVRSGGDVGFNNVYSNTGSLPVMQLTFAASSQTGSMIGCADGKRFWDVNERGTISYNTYSFDPVSTPADTRLGSVYATGTGGTLVTNHIKYVVTGLDGGSTSNKWKNFIIRNLTYASSDAQGGQAKGFAKSYARILTSTTGLNCIVTLQASETGADTFVLGSTDPWEITRIKEMAFAPGAGPTITYTLNGGNILNSPNVAPLLIDSSGTLKSAPNPTFVNTESGIWRKNNVFRTGTNGSFQAVPVGGAGLPVAGGVTNDYPPGYPLQTSDTAHLRIGADIANPSEQSVASEAYGATYPHPFRQSLVGKLIFVSGNMTFSDTIVGSTSTSTLTISNQGDTDFTVSSITYPTGFSGAYSGTVVAGGNHSVTVTFTPVSAIVYNGTITVNSDATGTNTIAATGTGTPPVQTGSPHPDRERSGARKISGLSKSV